MWIKLWGRVHCMRVWGSVPDGDFRVHTISLVQVSNFVLFPSTPSGALDTPLKSTTGGHKRRFVLEKWLGKELAVSLWTPPHRRPLETDLSHANHRKTGICGCTRRKDRSRAARESNWTCARIRLMSTFGVEINLMNTTSSARARVKRACKKKKGKKGIKETSYKCHIKTKCRCVFVN